MTIYVDIDETIFMTQNMDYENSQPFLERIQKINKLYDEGHTIVYWTARGSGSGKDWSKVTKDQFERYGVKHHTLKFGKPVYDLFLDDKNINSEVFFK